MEAYTAAKSVYLQLTEPLAVYLGTAGRAAARKKIIDAIGEENVFENVGKIIRKFDTKGQVLFLKIDIKKFIHSFKKKSR